MLFYCPSCFSGSQPRCSLCPSAVAACALGFLWLSAALPPDQTLSHPIFVPQSSFLSRLFSPGQVQPFLSQFRPGWFLS